MNKGLTKLLSLFILIISLNANAQRFADEMHFSPDWRRLITGHNPYSGFYDSNTIHTINLQFSDPNYWTMLTNNFPSRTDMPATVTVDGVVYDSVGVRFKGNSSYNAIGNSPKKSFNLSFDDWVHGQNADGYSTIVLNNCYNNPSFMNEVLYEYEISKHVPAPKGNFTHLFINGQDWGIYDDVEQLNHDYEKEWFGSHTGAMWRSRNPMGSPAPPGRNGDSLASLYDFGIDTTFYRLHYNLKFSHPGVPDPWKRLMTLIRVLDTAATVNVESVLGDYLEIDRALWFLASEVAYADDDSYLFKGRKDYYIYFEPETNRITPLEMDGNDTYDITIANNTGVFYNSTNSNLPLLKKLLNKPWLRQRYLAHMRTIVKDEFNSAEQDPIIDSYYSMIDSFVQADPKKLYTYADFVNYRPKLKQFVVDRRAQLLANTEMMDVGPTITNTTFYADSIAWKRPAAYDSVWVTTNVTSGSGIDHISLYTSTNLTGKFLKTVMYDDGQHYDQAPGDGIFGAKISGKPGVSWVRFYIEAAANNAAKTVSFDPEGAEHDVYIYLVLPSHASDTSVVINELMAKNISTASDSAGHSEDWIELYNNSNQMKDISGYYLTDSIYNLIKWKIPQGTIIPANGYQIIWADENKREGRYHTNFHLSSTHGETLLLLNSNHELVDEVTFGPQPVDKGYARIPNSTGSFVIQPPTFNANNNAVPHASITVNDTVCSLAVTFSNSSSNATNYFWNFGDGTSLVSGFAPMHTYSNPGNYSVSLIAGNGTITDTDYATITIYSDPSVNFGTDTIISSAVTYQLNAGPGFPSYHWSTNATTQVITVDAIGTYCVGVLTPHGCINETCVYVIVNANGIENLGEYITLLYPNPADDHLILFSDDSRKTSLEVFNTLGEMIFKKDFSKSVTINTQSWAEGVYFVRLGSISKVLVVRH